VNLLLIGGHGYLGSALRQALPEAAAPRSDYAALTAAEMEQYAWIVFLANRKQEGHSEDGPRFDAFIARLPERCRLLLVSSAAAHGTGEHAEKMRRRERSAAGRSRTWIVRPGSVCGPAANADPHSLLNRMVADARSGNAVQVGAVDRPVLTTRDWVRAVEHILRGEVPEGTYELASFNAWMPALGAEVARRFAATVETVPGLGRSLDCRIDTAPFERTGFTYLDGLDSAISEAERAIPIPATHGMPLPSCLCCGAANPRPFLDFGRRPLANALRDRPDAPEIRYPLELAECGSCGHWQLTVAVDSAAMFPPSYPYRAGTTETTRAHFRDLAAACASRVAGRRALEIGCNDGTLLRALAAHGFAVRGVDPAPQTDEFPIVRTRWSSKTASELFPGTKLDLVCASNVLAHVPDPVRFLVAVRSVLAPEGLAVVEVTDTDAMVRASRWDLVYHEHLSYFREAGLSLAAGRAGLRVDAIEKIAAHGGSLRAWMSRRPLDAERFSAEVRRQVETLRATLVAAPGPLVGFGCPAKAALLVEEVGVRFAYLADNTPAKIGKYAPGTGCEIRPLAALAAEPGPVTIVLLAWNYPDEFAAWMRTHREGRGDLVIHLRPDTDAVG
jgi:SAM-dependent methyltransferase